MKKFLLFIVILSSCGVVNAQNTLQDVAGTYEVRFDATNGLIIYTLNLNTDGRFLFHSYEKIDRRIPPERNQYAKGTWTLDKKVVSFSTSSTDFDEKMHFRLQ